MKLNFHTGLRLPAFVPKFLLVMKLTFILLVTAFLQVSMASFGQKVTIKGSKVSAVQFLEAIKAQTPYKVLYAEEMLPGLTATDLSLNNASVEIALETFFKDKPITYTLTKNVIVLKYRPVPVPERAAEKNQAITGKITDSKNHPIGGVNITLKGTSTGTTSDSSGDYKLTVPDGGGTLVFSYVGFETKEVIITRNNVINVQLTEVSQKLSEVVVVAFGTTKKSSLTAAVSEVKGSELVKAAVPNITQSIAGRMAGIAARPNGGVPGQDNPNIFVRGISTTGNNGALIVIDGIVRNNISQVDPNTIESVTVLKDAAAVAPYGLGGANGVILITTKHGKAGTASLSLSSYYGFQRPTFQPTMLNAKDYMTLKNEGDINSGLAAEFDPDLIANYDKLHAENPDKYPNSNAQREMVKTNTPQQNYNLQLSGGNDKMRYYVGFNFFKQNGIYDPLVYNRYNYNVMLDVNATSTTKVTLSLNNAVEYNQTSPNPNGISYIPVKALYYSNGLWGESGGYSPIADLKSGSYARTKRNQGLNSISVDQQLPFVKGLSVKGVFSYDPSYTEDKGWSRPTYYYLYDGTVTPATYTKTLLGDGVTTLSQGFGKNQNFTYQGILNYHDTFGDHDLTGLIVAEARDGKSSGFNASRRGFSVNVDELDLGTSDRLNFNNGGSSGTSSQLGYVYRIDYGFKGKYLFGATGRYDGHYYFAPGKRWAYFPAFSAGWRLSEESFIKDHLNWVDNLKLKGSWGKSGNLAGSAFQYLSAYNLYGNAYAFGTGSLVQGSYVPLEANPNITWEKSTKSDVGIEFSFWKGKLTMDADVFYEKRTGMLLPPAITVPVEYGLNLAQENAGIMENRGLDLTIGTNHRFDNGLLIGATGTFLYAKNKLLQVFETSATKNNPNRSRTGRQLGTPFGYQALGLFKKSDDKNEDGVINAADGYNVTQFGTLHPGDIKYADLNGDGKIDANDETAVGNPLYPSSTYGLNINASWKGFDVNIFFQGAAGASINVQGYQTIPFRINNTNTSYEYFNNRWTPEHEDTKYPRSYASKSTNNTTNPINGDGFGDFSSSFWMKRTNFLRLKTAVIGYTIPPAITKKVSIQNLRVFASGQNIFTMGGLGFMDPETGFSQREEAYPVQKAFIFGVQVTF
ncbi:TonB-linked SusC/RagA family outer membrane protein [Mucilaginibacter sp. SG538B]|uniref:SusC/RagA family TonB-linked outer membrane protein n=1 Tax=Mucilaginibacter sp. SG538B TaxID=2587021 RepID=UPI00180A3BCF|nr:TonB-dependent receptor [Mucilaginibacter sp. SG538B]NVM67293.1 TonB-linked SusC/RagA family outer membrane protein [Mucilaginibacter sp. SG538B]